MVMLKLSFWVDESKEYIYVEDLNPWSDMYSILKYVRVNAKTNM